MAGFAVPVIEGAGILLMRALGFGAAAAGGAVVLDAERKRRAEAADDAKAALISQAGTQTKSKPCDKCPPDAGAPSLQPTAGWKPVTIAYQQRIGQMPPAPPGYLAEWKFNGVDFDGFASAQCLLKEAKAGYDQFFDEYGDLKEWFRGFIPMQAQFERQAFAATPRPPVQLRWHFMEAVSYRYFSRLVETLHPDIEVVFLP